MTAGDDLPTDRGGTGWGLVVLHLREQGGRIVTAIWVTNLLLAAILGIVWRALG